MKYSNGGIKAIQNEAILKISDYLKQGPRIILNDYRKRKNFLFSQIVNLVFKITGEEFIVE